MDYYQNKRKDEWEITTLAAPKVLALGKPQNILVFLSLNRALAAPKVLTLGKPKNILVFLSLNRTFASKNMNEDGKRL